MLRCRSGRASVLILRHSRCRHLTALELIKSPPAHRYSLLLLEPASLSISMLRLGGSRRGWAVSSRIWRPNSVSHDVSSSTCTDCRRRYSTRLLPASGVGGVEDGCQVLVSPCLCAHRSICEPGWKLRPDTWPRRSPSDRQHELLRTGEQMTRKFSTLFPSLGKSP